eukprot:TRINITY_DN2331_c0_g3_i1.p1 TRINITY_DN2331_c0_g3~~TRINITY_DN2331_c0_g3_i1.p1  ORF type:complete len:263 (-),score=29.11 TRINITY_DN2331_c0_g3_i1:171-959(-)
MLCLNRISRFSTLTKQLFPILLLVSQRTLFTRAMSTPPIVLKATKPHTASVIFCHGLGDTGEGWSDTAEELQRQTPWIKYILPTARSMPVSINGGHIMPSWYDIYELSSSFDIAQTREEDTAGLEDARKTITGLIEQEVKSGIPENRIIVGGFSQGAVVSLFTVYQHEKPLAGAIALSGYLPAHKNFASLVHPANRNTPLFMAHGDSDQVVAYEWGSESFRIIKAAGIPGEFITIRRMGHSATQAEISSVAAFITKQLPEKP